MSDEDNKVLAVAMIMNILIVTSVLAIVGLIYLAITKLGMKTEITSNQYIEAAEMMGFSITDLTEDYKELDEHVINFYVATNEEESYVVEFYVFDDEDYCKDYYRVYRDELAERRDSVSNGAHAEANLINWNSYTVSLESNYAKAVRVGSTIVYVDVFGGKPSTLEKFLKSIGYK